MGDGNKDKASNSNPQAPGKPQATSHKRGPHLKPGAWSFPAAWSLKLGVFSLAFQEAFDFAGDDQFFIGRDYHYFDARFGGTNHGFNSLSSIVLFRIQQHAELVEVSADGLAKSGTVLADASGKNERIGAVQLKEKSTDPMPGLMRQDIKSQFGPGVSLRRLCFDVAQVVVAA